MENKIGDKSPIYLNIEHAAELLNIKVSRLRTAVFRKEVPFFRIGRLLRFDPLDIATWVENNKKTAKRSSK